MKKILKVFVTIVLALSLVAIYFYWDSTMNSPTNFKVTYLDIEDEKIPDNFKGVKILYFSDLCYGSIFTEQHLEKLKKTVSTVDYDIVIFGGDLIDLDYSAVSNDVDILEDFFSSLDARLGKFYILGDFDKTSDTRAVLVKKVLNESNFEQITDVMSIYNGLSGHITFSSDTVEKELYADVYNIAIVHESESTTLNENIDFVLSGHSHIKQTSFFEALDYKLGLNGNTYRVRSVGMTECNYRILNTPEILLIRY